MTDHEKKLTVALFPIILIFIIIMFASPSTPQNPELPLARPDVFDQINETRPETTLSEPELVPAVSQAKAPSQQQVKTTGEYYLVTKVVDGDTIDVDINGSTTRLRLIGIDTPEVVDPRKIVECFGHEASLKAKELLLNQKVRLEADPTQDDRDRYGRLLRYVFREDGLFYNRWIIENGYAHEYTFVIPYRYQSEFQQAENSARENQLGLWHPDACASKQSLMPDRTLDQIDAVQAGAIAGKHIFYTSNHYSSKTYYCDTDPAWKDLSEKYREEFADETELRKKYPAKTLHEPCR